MMTRRPGLIGIVVVATVLVGLLALQANPAAAGSFRVYVVNAGDENVVVFDTDTLQRVGAPLPVGQGPVAIAISPDGSRAYVVNNTGDNVLLLLPPTLPPTFIPVGSRPTSITITPDGAYAYVTNFLSDSVSVIATATSQIIKVIPLASGSSPAGIAITPDGTRAYVTNLHAASVSVI